MGKFRALEPYIMKSLIEAVKAYPEIYAIGNVNYNNASKKEIAWKKIKEKMGMDVRMLKIKWKNLRDTYRKHILCRQVGAKGPNNLSNWLWAKEMAFVEPYIKLKSTDVTSNGDTVDSTDSEINDDNSDEENEPNDTQKEQSPEPEPPKAKRRRVKRRRKNSDVETADVMTNTNTEKNTQETVVVTNLNIERNLDPVVEVPCDRIDMEFLGYSNTVKRLSLSSQALVKLQITKILTQFQLQELTNGLKSSMVGHATYKDDGPYMTTVQLTDLEPYFINVDDKRVPDGQTSSSST